MVEHPSSVISLRELRDIVIARPHSQHKFKNEIIDRIIPCIVERTIDFLNGLAEQSKDC